MRRRRYSREDALDRYLYADLYQGALRIKNPEARLIAVTFVLLTGRLKMRISEAMHFHEGWLRRKYGLIEIPSFEPCICKDCHRQAKANHTAEDPYDDVEERMVNERYRTKNRRKRYVPISWSPRIVACIEAYVDEIGVYPHRARTATRLLQERILPNCELLEPGDVDWRGMRATGDTFWAFSGLETKARAEMGGHRETELGTYSGASPVALANQVRLAQGLEPLEIESFDYVTTPPNPHPNEPFDDPRTVDPLAKHNPHQAAPIFNPRTDVVRADIDISGSDYDLLALRKRHPSRDHTQGIVSRLLNRLEGPVDTQPEDLLREKYKTQQDDEPHVGQSILDEFKDERGMAKPIGIGVARLGREHESAKKSSTWQNYPFDAKQSIAFCGGIICWAAFIGLIWGLTGLFTIHPTEFDVQSSSSLLAGIALGLVFVVHDLPKFE